MRSPKLLPEQNRELLDLIKSNASTKKEITRAQAILMLDKEKEIDEIIQLTAYQRSQIFELRKQYLKKGIASLKDKREAKPKELLTRSQKNEIIEILKTKSPKECDSYFIKHDFWTAGILAEYIKRKYDVQYKSKTSIYVIFRQSKFSYHKPGRVYHRRDEQEVAEWQKTAKPILKRAWSDQGKIILCEDEMILSTQTTTQKIWLPQGQYPKIEVSNKKENRSVYGFLNLKTGQEHAFKTQTQTMYITADILARIRGLYPNKKILLLWDGAGWHRGSIAQEFIKQDGNIKTVYFPRYSPEENPQEHVWKNGRGKATHNKFIEDIDVATDEFIAYLNANKHRYSLLGFAAKQSDS